MCCDPGAGSSSCTSWEGADYCHLQSISAHLPMIYTCLSFWVFTACFYTCCFTACPLPHYAFVHKPAFCFLLLNVMHSFLPTPVLLGEFHLRLTGWSWFVKKCLMLDDSVKLAIISTAWIETQEQKHCVGMGKILNIHMFFRTVLLFPAACSLKCRCWALYVLKSSRWICWLVVWYNLQHPGVGNWKHLYFIIFSPFSHSCYLAALSVIRLHLKKGIFKCELCCACAISLTTILSSTTLKLCYFQHYNAL